MRFNSICMLVLFSALASACTSTAEVRKNNESPVAANAQNQPGKVEQELERRLKSISDGAQGTVGLSVVHIESGKTISINGNSQLPLYSVFKLPVAQVTNDVGIITLPSGRGHLAIAVLLRGSKLPDAAQEKLIAELARAAYDAYSNPPLSV